MAQTKITFNSLSLQSVETKNIKDRSVVANKIDFNAVKSEHILNQNVGFEKFAPTVTNYFSNNDYLLTQMLPLSGGTVTGLIKNSTIPAFSCYFGLRTGVANATVKLIDAENVGLNVLNCYTNSNGRFTAPVDGIYSFSFIANRNNQAGTTPRIKIVLNDTTTLAIGLLYTTSYTNATLNVVASLTKNSYVHCESNGTHGGAPDLHSSYFSGFLINPI
jgi:hypothetical protein